MYNPQLETFIKVADAGSFNKAAKGMFITPSAVIKQINLLESSLDLKLFERTHRGLRLTRAGESLYRDSKYIIQYCRDSVTRAKNAMLENASPVRIGSSLMTPAQMIMRWWPQIQKYCPDIKFQIVPFENTEENAREILANLGKNIDIVAGIFDDTMLQVRHCEGLELTREPFCCAVSLDHPLASKNELTFDDLNGQKLMLMHRGWSSCVDQLRDEILQHHPDIRIVDFDFYDVNVFNRCENGDEILLVIEGWEEVHPMLKMIPVRWDYVIPFGLLHSGHPSATVSRLLEAAEKAVREK